MPTRPPRHPNGSSRHNSHCRDVATTHCPFVSPSLFQLPPTHPSTTGHTFGILWHASSTRLKRLGKVALMHLQLFLQHDCWNTLSIGSLMQPCFLAYTFRANLYLILTIQLFLSYFIYSLFYSAFCLLFQRFLEGSLDISLQICLATPSFNYLIQFL